MPALLTRMSRWPYDSTMPSTPRLMPVASVTSKTAVDAREAQVVQLLRRGGELLGPAAVQHDGRAGLREALGDGEAEAAIRAGDERDFSGEVERVGGHRRLLVCRDDSARRQPAFAASSSAATIRATRASSASVESSSLNISTSSGNANGVGRGGLRQPRALSAQAAQRGVDARRLELALQHLAHRLRQQQVVRIVFGEDLVEQRGGRLQLPRRIRLAGIALEDEPGDARDLAELAAAELGGVDPREDVRLDARRGEQAPEVAQRQRHRARARSGRSRSRWR